MDNLPLVSVVICTYNGASFIDDQVESARKQTYSNLELVIIDDHSTDDTYQKLSVHAQADPRIKLSRNEKNLGYNLNFSKACQAATGEFIAIADQDDIWEIRKIEILMKAIQKDPGILLVHCISARFEEFGKFHLRSNRLVNYHAGKDARNFFISNFISGHNMLLRKHLLEMALPFPGKVYYDWWLAVVATCNGKIVAVPEILVWHRMHATNATGAGKPKISLYKQVLTILPQLLTIKEMKESDKEFARQLMHHYSTLTEKRFSWPLFFFLAKHAPVLLAHKKRAFPWISYLKHSFKSAKASTLA